MLRLKIIDINTNEIEIEIDKTEQVKNIIKIYCEKKGLSNPYFASNA